MFQIASDKEGIFHTKRNLIERTVFLVGHVTLIRYAVCMTGVIIPSIILEMTFTVAAVGFLLSREETKTLVSITA